MGFSDEYLALKMQDKKKKKKNEKTTGHSFTDEYNKKKNQDEDIAPVKETQGDDIWHRDAFTVGSILQKNLDSLPVSDSSRNKEVENIAPVNEEDQGFFKRSGLFDDGYDFGDVTKAILGMNNDSASLLDLTVNSAKRGYYNSRYGEESFKAMEGRANKKEYYEDLLAGEDYQFTPGNKLAEGVSGAFELLGQMGRQFTHPRTLAVAGGAAGAAAIAGQAGPQVLVPEEIVSVPAAAAAGLAAGSAAASLEIEAGHAYNELIEYGVSPKTAKAIALGVGTANAALELVQVDELIDAYKILNKSGTTKKFTQKLFGELLDRGIDVAKETGQEVLQEGVTIAGVQAGSKIDTGEWAYDAGEVKERLLDTAKSSALSFGMMNAPAAAKNTFAMAKEHNAANKLSEIENKVVDRVYEEEVAKRENLTASEKAKLRKSIVTDMEKGRINTDIIEEVLDEESYGAFKTEKDNFFNSDTMKSYRESLTNEETQLKELQKQLDELTDAPNTVGNSKRYDEIASQIAELKNNPQSASIKAQLDEEVKRINEIKNQMRSKVYEQVKGSKLAESYNELIRSGEKYTVDTSKYTNEYARKTIENIVKSGMGDNTTKFHEYADWLAQLSADKGMSFSLTNNEALKGTVHDRTSEGLITNGFKTADGITLNMDSPKALNSTVGHEVTHVLEGTEFYDVLKESMFNYAISKEGLDSFNSRIKTAEDIYKGDENTTPEAEVLADLVGDYLFTDYDYVHKLSTENRNVFQKIYDEIKYLCKVVTAGSKEARELEKVKKAFDAAYRANVKGKAETQTQHSFVESFTDSNGTRFDNAVLLDTDFFDGTSPRNWGDKLREKVDERAENDPFILPIVDENGNTTLLEFASSKDRVTKDGASNHRVLDKLSSSSDNISKLAVIHIDEIVSVSEENSPYYTNENNHQWLDQNGWLHRNANVINQKNGNIYNLTVDIAKAADGRTILYATDGKIKKVGNVQVNSLKIKGSGQNPNFSHNVPQNGNGVKHSFSDSTGKELTKEQQDFFKDSKMRDENGNLKVMYHGSQDAGFHVFDAKMSDDDTSFFFVDRNDVAASYSGTSETYEAKTIRSAEDMNNFLAEIGHDEDYEVVEKDGKFELLYEGDRVAESNTAQGIYEEFCWYEGVGDGDANYKVYLNLKNPLVVDAEDRNWDNVSREYSQEVYDAYQSLTESEKEYLTQLASWEEFGTFRDEILDAVEGDATEDYALAYISAYNKLGGKDADLGNLFAVASDGFTEDAIKDNAVKRLNTRDYAQRAKEQGYDGVIFNNIHDNGGYSNGSEGASTVAIAFDSNQIKSVANEKPTNDADIRYSLSNAGEAPKKYGNWNVYGSDFGYKDDTFAPIKDTPQRNTTPTATVEEMFPDEPDMEQAEYENLISVKEATENRLTELAEADLENPELAEEYDRVFAEWTEAATKALEMEAQMSERFDSLSDADAPPEMDAPVNGKAETASNPFADRNWHEVGKNRKVKAFMRENPEFKPFFKEEALNMLYDLSDSQKGERWYNDHLYYESGGEKGFGGQSRFTSQDIEHMLDSWGMSYDQIYEGLTAIAEDSNKVNNAAAKRIEFMLNQRLMNGYKDFHTGKMVEPNRAYIDMVREWQHNQQASEDFDSFMATADQYAPEDDFAPVKPVETAAEPLKPATPDTQTAPVYPSTEPSAVRGQTTMFAPEAPKSDKVAEVLTKPSKKPKDGGIMGKVVSAVVDKGRVFEDVSLDSGNMEVQAKWNYALPTNTEARAQYFMENGENGVKAFKSVMKEVNKSKKTDLFQNYLYHVHNIDRMTLDERFGVPNKAVYGDTITADVSRRKAAQLAKQNPEFKQWAQDIYNINKQVRNKLVEGGLISQEVADLWEQMYPHFVPIKRVDQNGLNVNVPLDTNKTGVNAPVKRATGGNSDIEPLFNTMAQRIEQTFRAIARNSFGVELMNTLGTKLESKPAAGVDEMIDTIEMQEELLKQGGFGVSPTFTVFENGERVEFEITEDMYDALKPTNKVLAYRNPVIKWIGDKRRNLLTVWNPVFALYRNPIKDIQDVAVNSQHPLRTYLNVPNAIVQLTFGGKMANEYHQNGGKSNTYFDSRKNKFKAEDNIFKKTIGMPVRAIENAGEFIEEIPRLAEYIASRKDGRSVERSMLDAARVTTNFAAGGDFTKWLNSHGFTFLNASVQGAAQHVRNFREATKRDGLMGFTKTLAKYVVAGVPGMILNGLLWDDDEEYEELNDYVKENYYVVSKTDDGKFIRIPKGRTTAVMHEALEQMQNLVTGDEEADFATFFELFWNNIAPNNPLKNNILSPVIQAATNNAWYEGDIVPTRLQDVPAEEQFDESTDSISKWLGEKMGMSPMKINYLLDQYSGGLGDTFLPMLTPEAESGDDSTLGNILAPWKKEITTDKVLNNKNPGDFYDLRDELEIVSNGKNATDEDKMKSLYMDAVSWEMGDLYAQKREIQSSDLLDSEKYEQVRQLQEQINELAKNAMSGYEDVSINGLYSEVGDKRFNLDKDSGTWYEIKPTKADGSANWYYQKEQEVTKGLGISYGEYWNNREEYNYAYDYPEKYTFSKAVGGYKSYRSYTSDLYDIKADKDENGKSISGSRKDKVIDYINEMDADYGEKIILFKSEYPADDTYNQDIFDYVNGRDDLSYDEKVSIFKFLEFEVDSEGYVTW